MKNILQILGTVIGLSLVAAFVFYSVNHASVASASAIDGQTHNATTTRNFDGSSLTNFTLVRNGPGVFGSVIITGANTGIMNFYDATTTDVSKRTGSAATSTILVASFPASTAAGTYVFDVTVKNGLIYELVSGLAPTSTITTR